MRRCAEGDRRQAPQQDLNNGTCHTGEMIANEASQAGLHLPGGPANDRQRPEVRARGATNSIDELEQLCWSRCLNRGFASGDKLLVIREHVVSPAFGESPKQRSIGEIRSRVDAQERIEEHRQRASAALHDCAHETARDRARLYPGHRVVPAVDGSMCKWDGGPGGLAHSAEKPIVQHWEQPLSKQRCHRVGQPFAQTEGAQPVA